MTWRRADKDVSRLNGLLYYREKLALPDQVLVAVRLAKTDGTPLAQTLIPSSGQGEVPFRVYYLTGEAGPGTQATVQVDIMVAGVKVLGTPEPQTINLNDNPRIMVQRASEPVTDGSAASPALEETYWRLTTLKGQPVQLFEGQPEPHVIIRENSQAAGSDGCNNFFFEWTKSGEKIRFGRGGSTLRLCPEGMEQAKSMMDALNKAETWSISGHELELKARGESLAVFQAVNL